MLWKIEELGRPWLGSSIDLAEKIGILFTSLFQSLL